MKNKFLQGLLATLAVAAFATFFLPGNALALNSAGDHVYASLYVSDGTGVVTTVTTGGTFYDVAGSPMAASEADGSSLVACSATTGLCTVSSSLRQALGEYEIMACLTDVIGANSAVIQARLARTRSASTAVVAHAPVLRRTEAGTAVRAPFGCISAIVDVAAGDAYGLQVTSGTNADTVTIRGASLSMKKLLNK